MSPLFFITGGIFLLYLFLQAIEDAKSKTVFVWANNAAVALMSALYFGKCVFLKSFPDVEGVFLSYQFLLLYRILWKRMFGKGDAKAYCAMFLQSGFFFRDSTEFSLLIPLLAAFLANLFFVGWRILKGLILKERIAEIWKKKERMAFFPFLFAGYLASLSYFTLLVLGII